MIAPSTKKSHVTWLELLPQIGISRNTHMSVARKESLMKKHSLAPVGEFKLGRGSVLIFDPDDVERAAAQYEASKPKPKPKSTVTEPVAVEHPPMRDISPEIERLMQKVTGLEQAVNVLILAQNQTCDRLGRCLKELGVTEPAKGGAS